MDLKTDLLTELVGECEERPHGGHSERKQGVYHTRPPFDLQKSNQKAIPFCVLSLLQQLRRNRFTDA